MSTFEFLFTFFMNLITSQVFVMWACVCISISILYISYIIHISFSSNSFSSNSSDTSKD